MPTSVRPIGLPGGSSLLAGGSLVLDGCWPRELEQVTLGLSRVFDEVPAVIFVKNAETLRFELFNNAAEQFLGAPRQAVIGKSDSDFFPSDQVAFFAEKDHGVLQEGRALDIPREPIDTRHGRKWLHTRKIPIVDQQGSARYLLGISLDVTRRRDAGGALCRLHADLQQRLAALGRGALLAGEQRARTSAGEVDTLYTRYGSAVFGHCKRFLRSSEAAEDATQEVFVRALRQAGRWPAASELRPWLFRIATNYCLNELRRRRVRSLGPSQVVTAPQGSLEACLAARSELVELLEGLPQRAREVARLTYVEGLLQEEVAEILGISRRTVVSYLTQLRSRV